MKIMFTMFAVILLLLTGCYHTAEIAEPKYRITSFEQCAKEFPVKESYPRQCTVPDFGTFVEQVSMAEKAEEVTSQPDEEDSPAADEKPEATEDPRHVAEIMAVNHVQQMPEYVSYDGRNILATNIQVLRCPGCYDVEVRFDRDSPSGGDISKAIMHVNFKDLKVVDVTMQFEEPELMTDDECEDLDGRIVNAIGDIDCMSSETNVGVLDGHLSKYICCARIPESEED